LPEGVPYLLKPWNAGDLVEAITRAMGRS